jgi:uncharacterized protein YciI
LKWIGGFQTAADFFELEGQTMMRWMWLAITLLAMPVAAADYDAALADRLGADERGMKQYMLVILKTGANAKAYPPGPELEAIWKGHMANINRLASEGKLLVAGPLLENKRRYEGIFVLNVATVQEAEALLKTDPAVAAGALAHEIYGWYGSAAMMELPAIHARIDKTQH